MGCVAALSMGIFVVKGVNLLGMVLEGAMWGEEVGDLVTSDGVDIVLLVLVLGPWPGIGQYARRADYTGAPSQPSLSLSSWHMHLALLLAPAYCVYEVVVRIGAEAG